VSRSRPGGFEATIVLRDGSAVTASRRPDLWELAWEGHRWSGRSLVALMSEVPGPGLGPKDDVLGQVIDALIAEIERPAAVARCLQTHLGAHY
jgi:hypothetical protein